MHLVFAQSGLRDYRPFSSLFESVHPAESDQDFGEGDCLLFEGGTDISSKLYGERAGPFNELPNLKRDAFEVSLFKQAILRQIPMIGICRGAQLITALMGGKLLQHIEGHSGNPFLSFTGIVGQKKTIRGICAHHQACIPAQNPWIIAESLDKIPEIFWYPGIKALCIQGHPAWGKGEFTEICVDLAKQLIIGDR